MAQYATERSSGQCAGQINRQLNWHDRSSHDELDDTHVEGSVCRCAISSAFVPQLWVDVRQFANRVCILISFCFPFTHSFRLPILHMHIFSYMYVMLTSMCVRVCICELPYIRLQEELVSQPRICWCSDRLIVSVCNNVASGWLITFDSHWFAALISETNTSLQVRTRTRYTPVTTMCRTVACCKHSLFNTNTHEHLVLKFRSLTYVYTHKYKHKYTSKCTCMCVCVHRYVWGRWMLLLFAFRVAWVNNNFSSCSLREIENQMWTF